jgi:methionine-rich copper-binding protein CopC
VVLATLAALLLACLAAGPVLGHAELVEADPADGAELATPPTTITLTFSERLDPAKGSFRLLGPDGTEPGPGPRRPTGS